MLRLACLLALGVILGYSWGWKDARQHEKTVVERVLDRAGGSARGKYDQNLDQRAAGVER